MIDIAAGLIETAKRSLTLADEDEIEARRVVSSSYYAIFHSIAKCFADHLIGDDPEKRPNKAWAEVYRGLDHSTCTQACRLAIDRKVSFPDAIMDVAAAFLQLQDARHTADYDPCEKITYLIASVHLQTAEQSVVAIRNAAKNDILAFATWVLISTKGAKSLRTSQHKAPAKEPKAPAKT